MAKTFLTYQQQLHILEHEKQLAIPDPDYAKKMLEEISYYSLIGGYKSLFKHNASNKYAHGVTFDELVSFYYFDEEIRTLFLKYILLMFHALIEIYHTLHHLIFSNLFINIIT